MSEALTYEEPAVPFIDLPTRLRLAREKEALRQEDIASLLGKHRRTVANYESGKTIPQPDLLLKWAEICAVPPEWLTWGIDPCPNCGRSPHPPGGSQRRTCFSGFALVSGSDEGDDAPQRPKLTVVKS